MSDPRTEAAIVKIEQFIKDNKIAVDEVFSFGPGQIRVTSVKSGRVSFRFEQEGKLVAGFTTRSIVKKRTPKKKKAVQLKKRK